MTWLNFTHNGKRIGRISKDGLAWHTRRKSDMHFVYRHLGYGIQADVLDALHEQGVKTIVLDEVRPSGVILRFEVPVEAWRQGIRDKLRPADGLQVFLPFRVLMQHPNRQVKGRRV